MTETLDVVDENDNVIGKATREEIHTSGMWHRGVHVLVFDSQERLLLPVRSLTKDKFPNTYDCSVSEHVKTGETFEEAAIRGLREELGIVKPKLQRIVKFRMSYGTNDNTIAVLYKCRYSGKMKADKMEIKSMNFIPLGEVKKLLLMEEHKFAPWTRELLKRYLGIPSKIEEMSSGERRRGICSKREKCLWHPGMKCLFPDKPCIFCKIEKEQQKHGCFRALGKK